MGEAREVMDRLTKALLDQDFDFVASCYSQEAVAVTPDQGEVRGREAIVAYFKSQWEAFPDGGYESLHKHEVGNVAIDEGYLTGTNSGSLPMPSGETIPPTGKQIRVRACDIATVEGGAVSSHRFYFDQMEFLEQLGLMPNTPS